MSPNDILLPAMALIGWTLLVLLLVPYQRFKAAFAGKVNADDFRYGESERVPAAVSIPNRNYMNLLEAPLLFYMVCLISFVTAHVDALATGLAWGYFFVRVAQSLVHLTYNNVFHRLSLFATSNAVLFILWLQLLITLTH